MSNTHDLTGQRGQVCKTCLRRLVQDRDHDRERLSLEPWARAWQECYCTLRLWWTLCSARKSLRPAKRSWVVLMLIACKVGQPRAQKSHSLPCWLGLTTPNYSMHGFIAVQESCQNWLWHFLHFERQRKLELKSAFRLLVSFLWAISQHLEL